MPGQLHARLDILCLLHNIDNIRTIPLGDVPADVEKGGAALLALSL